MRILQLVQKPQRRGAEVFAYQLSQTLRNKGHQVCSVYLYPYQEQHGLALHSGDQVLDGRVTHPLKRFPASTLPYYGDCMENWMSFNPTSSKSMGQTPSNMALLPAEAASAILVLIYRNIGAPQDWVRGWQRRFTNGWSCRSWMAWSV
ncbi:MAG: hypothetical protein R2867_16960 [Caldilineaceae bacterium]